MANKYTTEYKVQAVKLAMEVGTPKAAAELPVSRSGLTLTACWCADTALSTKVQTNKFKTSKTTLNPWLQHGSSSKVVTVYGMDDDDFLVNEDGEFTYRNMDRYAPVPMEAKTAAPDMPVPCEHSVVRRETCLLSSLLAAMVSGEASVELGDTIGIKLLDGTDVDLVVTDQDDKTIRLESRDSLGINTSARDLNEYLDKVYYLLPDALKKHIVETERVHMNSDGEKYTERCKLFVPAASEIFPPDDCYGDEGLYTQLEWYKNVHNRVRADCKGGDSHWYWTSSPNGSNSTTFCYVSGNGDAFSSNASSANGVAPFGCIISKI